MGSGVICKLCGKGEIVSQTEHHIVWEPVSWREHFFGGLSCFEAIVDHRNLFQKLFKRIARQRETHTTTKNHCNVCGVRYEFIPAQNLQAPVILAGMIQISPGFWLANKSSSVFLAE